MENKDQGYAVAVYLPLVSLLAGISLILVGALVPLKENAQIIILKTGEGLIFGGLTAAGLAQKP